MIHKKIDKLDFIKIKTSALQKTLSRENKFAKDIAEKGLLSKIYKELLKLKNKKSRNPI